jgi:uncharacterized protein with von Willebrand factor type A (vWA) domain
MEYCYKNRVAPTVEKVEEIIQSIAFSHARKKLADNAARHLGDDSFGPPPEFIKNFPLEAQATEKVPGASHTALEVDDWHWRRGREVYDQSQRVKEALKDQVPEALKDQTVAQGPAWVDSCLTDFHAAAFEPEPKLYNECVDPRRLEFMKAVMESPEYQALHTQTALDTSASELATVAFAEQYGKLLEADQARSKDKRKQHPLRGEVDAAAAAHDACLEASHEVEQYGEMCRGLGGAGGGRLLRDPTRCLALYQRIRNDERLRKILDRLGPWRRCAQARQRQKTRHGYDDMIGVRLGGEVALALPCELALLADDDMQDQALARLVESQFLVRHYGGVEPKGKGPIAVIVDESGSMDNAKGYDAKAMATALQRVAQDQKRWCALCSFSGGTDGRWVVFPPGAAQVYLYPVTMPAGAGVEPNGVSTGLPEEALLGWLGEFMGGGTSCDVPLKELPFVWWPRWIELGLVRGKTDIVLLTDAEIDVPPRRRDDFNRWRKAEQAKVTAIILGHDKGYAARGAKQLAQCCDEMYSMPTLEMDDEAVSKILSL